MNVEVPPLRTSCYSAGGLIVASGLAAVRTSVGNPRFALPYPIVGVCRELMPIREILKLDERSYRPLYLGGLDAIGVEAIGLGLRRIGDRAGGRGLVLLCFEKLTAPDEWCHRRMFAEWWEGHTGQPVPELARAEIQPTLF